jgi:hypothetical protein
MQSEVRAVTRNIDLRSSREGDEAILESMRANEAQMKMKGEFIEKLDEKQREIEKLHAVIEATAPIPGFDLDMYKRLILAQADHSEVDYRDKKIVDLAKKVE